MLYDLLPPLEPFFGALRVVRYITFRTAAASLTALAISLVLGPWMIAKLRDFQIGQVIRQEGPQSRRRCCGRTCRIPMSGSRCSPRRCSARWGLSTIT